MKQTVLLICCALILFVSCNDTDKLTLPPRLTGLQFNSSQPITQTPSGKISSGQKVRLTANVVSCDGACSYAWTLDNAAGGTEKKSGASIDVNTSGDLIWTNQANADRTFNYTLVVTHPEKGQLQTDDSVTVKGKGGKDEVDLRCSIVSSNSIEKDGSVTFSVSIVSGSIKHARYDWSFGEGNDSTRHTTITHQYGKAGTFFPQVLVYEGQDSTAKGQCPARGDAKLKVNVEDKPDTNTASILLGNLAFAQNSTNCLVDEDGNNQFALAFRDKENDPIAYEVTLNPQSKTLAQDATVVNGKGTVSSNTCSQNVAVNIPADIAAETILLDIKAEDPRDPKIKQSVTVCYQVASQCKSPAPSPDSVRALCQTDYPNVPLILAGSQSLCN